MKINLLKIMGYSAIILLSSPALSMNSDLLAQNEFSNKSIPWRPATVQRIMTGIIRDDTGIPLPGVGIKNTTTGKSTVTDASGRYSIEVTSENDLIQFSYIGYTTQTVKAGTQTTFNARLLPAEGSKLDEVVVIGYGSINQREITSAITKVDSSQFRQSGSRNPLDLLIGKVAGLQVTRTSGTNPNSGVGIQLRGVTSLVGSQSPLIVIDGIPGGNLDLIQQDDVESITVLKDGSSAAVYGTRANAGVILITTKKGKTGPSVFDYNAYARTERLARKPDFMNAAELRSRIASGEYVVTDFGGDFDYFEDLINKDNVSMNHNLAVSGGSTNATYRASLNYRDLQGFAKENARKEYSIRLSLAQTGLKDKLTSQFNIATNFNRANLLGGGGWENVLTKNPTESFFNPDGSFLFTRNITNEVARLQQEKNRLQQQTSSVDGKMTLEIIPGLKGSVFGAVQRNATIGSEYRDRASQNSVENSNAPNGGYAARTTALEQNFNVEPTIEYTRKIGTNHNLTAIAVYSYRYEVNEGFNANNRGYVNDVFEDNNLGSVPVALNRIGIGSYKNDNTLIAFLGRINYSFGSKYFAQASLRREGSSRFGVNNKWASFPAVSAGWNVTEEDFMDDVSFVGNLKLRAGYGETGNSGFANYASLVTLGGGGIYRFPTNEYLQTYGPNRNPNPNLKWEKKQETNIGIDFTVLNNKLSGSIDVYNRKTKDLLDTYTSPQPPFIQSSIYTNVGTISAKGIELALSYDAINTGKFRWNIDFVGSTTKNKLDSYSDDEYKRDLKTFGDIGGFGALGQAIRTYEGRNLGEFWGKRFAGFTPDGKWTFYNRNNEIVSNAQINTSAFRDQTDFAVIGNAIPKYYLSLTNTFKYQGFDLRVFLRSKLDYDILNTMAISYGNKNGTSTNLLNSAFTKYAEIKDTYMYSDYYIESGSFLKIDEVTLGYTFKMKNDYVRNLRAYVTGQNLVTFTKYSGNDPDFVSDTGLGPGIDSRGPYPSTRQFLFGVSFGF
ncbi:SusC/RagA family TonB-linked outer membrane protein [Pedobacter metabolipauper]|uniref:TonB-linked SusC/RagA family outer membrane protein n=1 Tax=Pedobacter metabolipauper TaxID=425513 RepID=A0A4R6SW50_9SPHI|nr:SusC/RagA family TonB-linked outer membrane protein [Pedobacter metabolipauper]TDQ10040.1 TonB-linked SusC/RagA family outer membrane protein [Pedobacter metabolipauper]